MALELDDRAASGDGTREPQRRLYRLGAGRTEAHALRRGEELADQLLRLELDLALAAEQDPAFDLFADRVGHRLRSVAEDHRPHPEVVVDQSVAIDVVEEW